MADIQEGKETVEELLVGEESHTFAEAVMPLLSALSSYLALGDSLPNARVEASHLAKCLVAFTHIFTGWTESCRTVETIQLKDMSTCPGSWSSQYGRLENNHNQVCVVQSQDPFQVQFVGIQESGGDSAKSELGVRGDSRHA